MQRRLTEIAVAHKRTEPFVPVGHPDFKWTAGADVQATWRKYGWVPPSEQRAYVFDETTRQWKGTRHELG